MQTFALCFISILLFIAGYKAIKLADFDEKVYTERK